MFESYKLRYVAVEARDGSIFVCTERSARNMSFQDLLKLDKEVKPVCMIPGKMIIVYLISLADQVISAHLAVKLLIIDLMFLARPFRSLPNRDHCHLKNNCLSRLRRHDQRLTHSCAYIQLSFL